MSKAPLFKNFYPSKDESQNLAVRGHFIAQYDCAVRCHDGFECVPRPEVGKDFLSVAIRNQYSAAHINKYVQFSRELGEKHPYSKISFVKHILNCAVRIKSQDALLRLNFARISIVDGVDLYARGKDGLEAYKAANVAICMANNFNVINAFPKALHEKKAGLFDLYEGYDFSKVNTPKKVLNGLCNPINNWEALCENIRDTLKSEKTKEEYKEELRKLQETILGSKAEVLEHETSINSNNPNNTESKVVPFSFVKRQR